MVFLCFRPSESLDYVLISQVKGAPAAAASNVHACAQGTGITSSFLTLRSGQDFLGHFALQTQQEQLEFMWLRRWFAEE